MPLLPADRLCQRIQGVAGNAPDPLDAVGGEVVGDELGAAVHRDIDTSTCGNSSSRDSLADRMMTAFDAALRAAQTMQSTLL